MEKPKVNAPGGCLDREGTEPLEDYRLEHITYVLLNRRLTLPGGCPPEWCPPRKEEVSDRV